MVVMRRVARIWLSNKAYLWLGEIALLIVFPSRYYLFILLLLLREKSAISYSGYMDGALGSFIMKGYKQWKITAKLRRTKR
ncbi:hypothetical protein SY88_23180 [Clostridiales bacterium PH28_bin88]|jgi:hypothetical protein|nr:hypothetical protein SY88_23180 [Clostridiales bacterium PH28_bin88]